MATRIDSDALTIFTDGSSLPGRRGGTGLVFVGEDADGHPVEVDESPPGWAGATNNQMEIQAVIEALKLALSKRPPISLNGLRKIQIYSDSQYVVDNFMNAKFKWPGTQWRLKGGAPVANTSQWKELMRLVRRAEQKGLRVQIDWVKGHKRDRHNKKADKLAKKSAMSGGKRQVQPARVRHKKSPHRIEVGNVRMDGQDVTVHIVTDEYLREHRVYRYVYEVMDPDGAFTTPPDKIFSDIMLNAGHFYDVRLNSDQEHPQIEEVYREVDKEGEPLEGKSIERRQN